MENVKLLGGTSWDVILVVQMPYVVVWTLTALPNAISLGLVASVTAELLTGQMGMGSQLLTAKSRVDSMTFSVVLLVGVVLVVLQSEF